MGKIDKKLAGDYDKFLDKFRKLSKTDRNYRSVETK